MFIRPLSIVAVLLVACSASGQSPKAVITGPRESRCGSLVVLDASESTCTGRLWLLAASPEETSFLPVESGRQCIFASPVAGAYRFVLVVSGTNANGGPAADMATHEVRLTGGVTPQPIPPGPTPVPPCPVPPIPPTPTPTWVTTGLHVLIVDDENERGRLPQSQLNIFSSKALADYLASKCPKEADGQPAFRFSSSDSLTPGSEARKLELAVWVEGWDLITEAVEAGDVKLPAWIVSNGKTWFVESLPTTVDACLERLKGL